MSRLTKVIIVGLAVMLTTAGGLIYYLLLSNASQQEILNNSFLMREKIKERNTIAQEVAPANWINFESPYGWQVSYPPNWKTVQWPDGSVVDFISPRAESVKDKCGEGDELCYPFVTVNTYDTLEWLKKSFGGSGKVEGATLEQVVTGLKSVETLYLYTTAVPFFLGDNSAYAVTKLDTSKPEKAHETVVFLENRGFYYEITFRVTPAITRLGEEEKKILASLRLLKPSKTEIQNSISTTDKWSDYRNDKLGFSFSLPSDWQVKEESDKVDFLSPEDLVFSKWCEYHFCQAALISIDVKKYDNLSEYMKEVSGQTASYESLEKFLTVAQSENYQGIAKYSQTKVNDTKAFDVRFEGMGASFGYLIPYKSKIFEIHFYDALNPEELSTTERKILESWKWLN